MGELGERIALVVERLEWFRREDGATTVFGSDQHGYRTGPPLGEAELAAFEAEHDVTLPPDYRAYLGDVGNGGAGPYYGLSELAPLELDMLPQNHVVIRDTEGNVLAEAGTGPRPVPDVVSSIARPFQIAEEWSPEQGPLSVEANTSPYDGCVHLAEQGCGYFDFLVVRGAAAGQVWSDYTAGDGPICKTNDSFLDWYETWLEQAQLEWIEKNAMGMGLWAPRNYPGVDECVRLLDEALDRRPEWANGWRARGYVAVNRERLDDADAAFAKAAEHGRDEPAARLHLDRARLAKLRNQPEVALEETAAGLAESSVWASTQSELRRERLDALDALEDVDGALALLREMADDTYFELNNHYELAFRRLLRDEPVLAWAVLDSAVEGNVGPNRHSEPATRDGVYTGFADWLADGDEHDLADRVRAQL